MSSAADAFVHLFDWPFVRCEAALPALAAEGFTGIQVSPPQRSIDNPIWWGRYQPVDHTVLDGPLGNEADLRRLIAAAHQLGLKVLIDVVLNHMAGGPYAQQLRYPRFGPEHFRPRRTIDYNDLQSIREGWLVGMPDLRTEHPHVRAEARAYLELLVDCGADGFRFDAVKHMEPAYFAAVLQGLPSHLFVYGEYIQQPGHFPVMQQCLPHMRLMDFPLFQSLSQALGPEGDWAQMDRLEAPEAALPADRSVSFVTNHDLELAQYGGFEMPSDGLALAHAYTTCRMGAVPLVWMDHRDDPVLRAALQLRQRVAPHGWETVHASRQLLVWRCRSGRSLLVFNAARAPRHIDAAWLGGHGDWRDAVSGEGPHAVAPRQPGLFVRDLKAEAGR
jgi:alpha-amylase